MRSSVADRRCPGRSSDEKNTELVRRRTNRFTSSQIEPATRLPSPAGVRHRRRRGPAPRVDQRSPRSASSSAGSWAQNRSTSSSRSRSWRSAATDARRAAGSICVIRSNARRPIAESARVGVHRHEADVGVEAAQPVERPGSTSAQPGAEVRASDGRRPGRA